MNSSPPFFYACTSLMYEIYAIIVHTWIVYYSSWDALPEEIVQAPTLKMFKKGLDDWFKNNGWYR